MSENNNYEDPNCKKVILNKNKSRNVLICSKNLSGETQNKKPVNTNKKEIKNNKIGSKPQPKYRNYTPNYNKFKNNKELDKEISENFICWICGKTIPEKVRKAHFSYHKDEDEKKNMNNNEINIKNKTMEMNMNDYSTDMNLNMDNKTISMIKNNNSETNPNNNSFNMDTNNNSFVGMNMMNNNIMNNGMGMNMMNNNLMNNGMEMNMMSNLMNNWMRMNMNNNLIGMNNIPSLDNFNFLNNNTMNEEHLIDQQNMQKIRQIIEPYEERIKELEEKIRLKDLEITFLKCKYKYNDNLNNSNLFINYSHMTNPNNLYQMMNNFTESNINFGNEENKDNKDNLTIKIKIEDRNIDIQCKKKDKIKTIINRFFSKEPKKKDSYDFISKGAKIDINSNEEIEKLGLVNNDLILVVEKKEKQINNKENSSKEDTNSENNDSSEENKKSVSQGSDKK